MPTSETSDSWERAGRVPTMDGFRAIAIILVVLHHTSYTLGSTALSNFFIFAPHLGVDFSFVVSGFLITLLLLREKQRFGKISLKQFYLRRSLRLLPALAVYLVAIFLLTLITHARIPAIDWATACTFMVCFKTHDVAWVLGHLWTASVEEHFYIVWPLLFYFFQPRRAMLLAVGYLCATPLLRAFLFTSFGNQMDVDFASPTQMSNIAVGCVAAYVAFTHGNRIRSILTPRRADGVMLCSVLGLIASLTMSRISWKYRIWLTDPTLAIFIAALLLLLPTVAKASSLPSPNPSRWWRSLLFRTASISGSNPSRIMKTIGSAGFPRISFSSLQPPLSPIG